MNERGDNSPPLFILYVVSGHAVAFSLIPELSKCVPP